MYEIMQLSKLVILIMNKHNWLFTNILEVRVPHKLSVRLAALAVYHGNIPHYSSNNQNPQIRSMFVHFVRIVERKHLEML